MNVETYHETLKQIKKAINRDSARDQNKIKNARKSIMRASVAFELKDGTQAGDLKIEN